MTNIEKNDLVCLTRDLNPNMPEGLVGRVLQCHEDGFHVQFPLPGKSFSAQLPQKDVKFLVGNLPDSN